ncbi:MAG: D-alanyl-D-alanine dipeptidase [Caldilineae bacterium]|nr:MAG: D-alanyl-D-alanine dipeptidase [Caldilineae bacterium]
MPMPVSISHLFEQPLPPPRDLEGWYRVPIVESHEPMVDLEDAGFQVEHVYYRQGIPGSLPRCLAREAVVARLLQARALLPQGYDFLIWDAYRPLEVQTQLFQRYKAGLRERYPFLSEEELVLRTQTYVTLPSTDPHRPPPHSTGAALDLTLTRDGTPLDMGTPFDYFDREADSHFFEDAGEGRELQIRNNRRLLYHVLAAVGFKNYPHEWWHWSYGDQMACVGSGQPAIYGGWRDQTR